MSYFICFRFAAFFRCYCARKLKHLVWSEVWFCIVEIVGLIKDEDTNYNDFIYLL